MLNAIKRTWVPKTVAMQPMQQPVAPVFENTAPASFYVDLFDGVPHPEVEELNSDSIWATFESVQPMAVTASR